jgi:23S rRNA pseudouridine2457 synthase
LRDFLLVRSIANVSKSFFFIISFPLYSYFAAYKPFQCLSQFTAADGKKNLKVFFTVAKDIYPVGRLDYDSEGLLLLTNDPAINHRLLNPAFLHQREYLVQLEGSISATAMEELKRGVVINVDGKMHMTKPSEAKILSAAPELPERNPAIRFRRNIPTSWISLVLIEGKNRQVRKMTAKVGFPTLRLIRYRIGSITLAGLKPGEMFSLTQANIYSRLSLGPPETKGRFG